MINHTRAIFIFSAIFLCNFAHSKIHEYETTHLKSTSGSGSAAILLEESAFLNPASIVFFNSSSVYAQKDTISTSDSANTSYPKSKSMGFVMAQGDPTLGGTFSYVNQEEDNVQRKRFGVSMASPTSNLSSLGFSVRSSTDLDLTTSIKHKYYQAVFGVTHVLTENTSLGVVLYDPFKSYAKETKVIVGVQQNIVSYISGFLDAAVNYSAEEISKTLILKAALQVRVLDDIYLRAGGYNDKIRNEKGETYGLAWVSPKLAFEFALKTNKSNSLNISKKDKETSFSLSLRGF
jgi:hypothetical protein